MQVSEDAVERRRWFPGPAAAAAVLKVEEEVGKALSPRDGITTNMMSNCHTDFSEAT
jgi:hypothetical protein